MMTYSAQAWATAAQVGGAESWDVCLQSEQRWPFTLGQYLWTGWDYIGEPTPYHTRSSYFGTIDTAGFPKDAYYVVQAAWLDPKTHPNGNDLFPTWTSTKAAD